MEGFEYILQFMSGNSDSRVPDSKTDAIVILSVLESLNAKLDTAAGRREFDGIAQEVQQDLAKGSTIRIYPHRRGFRIHGEFQLSAPSALAYQIADVCQQVS